MAVYLTLFGAFIVASVLLIAFLGAVVAYVEQIVDNPKDCVAWIMLAGFIGGACFIVGSIMLKGGA